VKWCFTSGVKGVDIHTSVQQIVKVVLLCSQGLLGASIRQWSKDACETMETVPSTIILSERIVDGLCNGIPQFAVTELQVLQSVVVTISIIWRSPTGYHTIDESNGNLGIMKREQSEIWCKELKNRMECFQLLRRSFIHILDFQPPDAERFHGS
jgi:hypothetical protein